MADLYGMDPARIERLRSPERLGYFDPAKICGMTLVDIGSGVRYLAVDPRPSILEGIGRPRECRCPPYGTLAAVRAL